MTEEERQEARALLHQLWGAHASGLYQKALHKPKWARLDALLGMAAPREKVTLEDIKRQFAADLEDP